MVLSKSLRNTAKIQKCRSADCSPNSDEMAEVSMRLGKSGKSKMAGFTHLNKLVSMMKESNVWTGSIKGYFFRGTIPTKMKSEIKEYSKVAGWQSKTTKRMSKSGIMWRAKGKRYLLIFANYRGMGNRIYCSLTII